MKVAAIQHEIVWEDSGATRGHLEPLVAHAAHDGARLVVLTEMFATGFSMDVAHMAEPPGGPTEQWLAEQARQHGIWLIGSIAQREPGAPKAMNNAIVAGPDGQRHRYTKIHPFSYGHEHRFYEAGAQFLTVDIEGVRTSVFICYDLRFADEFWALAHDTDLYVVVANWPEPRRLHWRALLEARAIENQAYVVGVNRVGTAPRNDYVGDSLIVDPLGTLIAEANGPDDAGTELVISADVDPGMVRDVRARFGFLDDRR